MSSVAVSAHSLGKRYSIAPVQTYVENPTLREAISYRVQRTARRLAGRATVERKPMEFQALHDVSFAVERGRVLGIIGRNGAGKSTLLKILSRVILPSEGYAEITGRLGSLLEIGTGFHPDLSGRENIFLNAAVLGMRRAEVNRRLEDILSLSEIGDFVDTPVKHYSSGMYVRLAFSVAVHMDPDILIVDEVLSVGDLAFQAKSFERMRLLLSEGRTVIFVSHVLEKVLDLADTVLWLDSGIVRAIGDPHAVCQQYRESVTA